MFQPPEAAGSFREVYTSYAVSGAHEMMGGC